MPKPDRWLRSTSEDLPFGPLRLALRGRARPGTQEALAAVSELAAAMPLASGHPPAPAPPTTVVDELTQSGSPVRHDVEVEADAAGRSTPEPSATAMATEPRPVAPTERSSDGEAPDEGADGPASAEVIGDCTLGSSLETEFAAARDMAIRRWAVVFGDGDPIHAWTDAWSSGWCFRSGAERPATWNEAHGRLLEEGRCVVALWRQLVGMEADEDAIGDGPAAEIASAALATSRLRELGPILSATGGAWLPSVLDPEPSTEDRLVRSARQGWGVDQQVLDESRRMVRAVRTNVAEGLRAAWAQREREPARLRPVLALVAELSAATLTTIQQWNDESAILTPSLPPWTIARLRWASWRAARRTA